MLGGQVEYRAHPFTSGPRDVPFEKVTVHELDPIADMRDVLLTAAAEVIRNDDGCSGRIQCLDEVTADKRHATSDEHSLALEI
jgi:hypothetical protein